MIHLITIAVDCPNGYRPVAFRKVAVGEDYTSNDGNVYTREEALWRYEGPRLIVEKIEPPYDWDTHAPFVPRGWWLSRNGHLYVASKGKPARGAFGWLHVGPQFPISSWMQWSPPKGMNPKTEPIQRPEEEK